MNHLSVQSLGVACPAKMEYSVAEPKTPRYADAMRLADVLLSKIAELSPTEKEFVLCRLLRGFPGPARLGGIHFPVDRRGSRGYAIGGGYTYDHIFSYR